MKPIKGFEGYYSITTDGKVFSHRANKFLKSFKAYSVKSGLQYLDVFLGVNGNGKKYRVHRLVAETYIPNPKNLKYVDHINGIENDNRIENLRWATHQDNMRNSKKHIKGKNTSKYKGVSWCKITKKWAVYVSKNKKVSNLGRFNTEIEAAKAYNNFAIKNYGEFANLNVI